MQHKTVLLCEAVDALDLKTDSIVFDGTFGSGGHAREINRRLGATGLYIGVDADSTAFAGDHLKDAQATIHLVNDNFKNITEILRSLHISEVDGILADLGWRIEQFTGSGKGFSFQYDEPLLMTYGNPEDYIFTAHDIVNDWEESSIADVIFGYGEDRYARRIAKAIVAQRAIAPITSTFALRDCVASAVPTFGRNRHINPATKTFQALRIAVNDELGILSRFLEAGFEELKAGGMMAIITFHSLEDRIIKHYFRNLEDADRGVRITKRPVVPTPEELVDNPRARSAKLRVIKKY
jgi:16S rRNA (cytosine1402-N4)-methyltransferase